MWNAPAMVGRQMRSKSLRWRLIAVALVAILGWELRQHGFLTEGSDPQATERPEVSANFARTAP